VHDLAPLDWIIMAVYGAAVLGIGFVANRRQKNGEDYFLGGRALPWWAVGASLIATSFSAASLIGGTGFGFMKGMGYLQLQIGDFLALAAVAFLLIPFFARLRLTTAYEYLEQRFGVVARTVASLLFVAQTLLRTSLLFVVPAIALSAILGWSLGTSILVTAAAAITYSAFGGIAAVVWTDLIQMAVVSVGVAYCLVVVVTDIPGGLGAVIEHADAAGRLDAVTWSMDFTTPFNVPGAIVAYGVLAFSLFGTGQQAVQRFLACADVASARKAAALGWTIGTAALAACLFLGVGLAAWVDLAPPGTSAALGTWDEVLPGFIRHRVPAGMAGLLLAAIFAAAMSSIDSAIHSMSTCALVDFVGRFRQGPLEERERLRLARLATVLFGVIAINGALIAAAEERGILVTLVTWLGYLAGPLLALFLLGVLTRRANERGVLIGVAVGFAGIIIVQFTVAELPFHALWFAPMSCAVTLVVGALASLLFPRPAVDGLAGLTWWTRGRGAP
jgi:solute:Na+ symporter, SSS family